MSAEETSTARASQPSKDEVSQNDEGGDAVGTVAGESSLFISLESWTC